MEVIPHEFEALAVLLVLLPGFLSARIVQALCVRPKQTEVDKVFESLLYSFVVYVCFAGMFGGSLPVHVKTTDDHNVRIYSVAVAPKPLVGLATISVLVGLLVGIDSTKDFSGRFFRWAGWSQKTTRSSIWSDIFHQQNGVVQVGLADGRRLIGVAAYYSDDPKEGSLFLRQASWIDSENKKIPIAGDGILLTKEARIEHVEFLTSVLAVKASESNVATPLSQTPAESPAPASTE